MRDVDCMKEARARYIHLTRGMNDDRHGADRYGSKSAAEGPPDVMEVHVVAARRRGDGHGPRETGLPAPPRRRPIEHHLL
ncbi:hypothetical protein WME89_14300 [Sorangium sp. So ce321]|uniref:hypothetical protein n=1 Tax=Sorangium sp. So ce321 TaxID=3133300 RepID=UPI003F60857A